MQNPGSSIFADGDDEFDDSVELATGGEMTWAESQGGLDVGSRRQEDLRKFM